MVFERCNDCGLLHEPGSDKVTDQSSCRWDVSISQLYETSHVEWCNNCGILHGPKLNQLTHPLDNDFTSSCIEELEPAKLNLSRCRLWDLTWRTSSDNVSCVKQLTHLGDDKLASSSMEQLDPCKWNLSRCRLWDLTWRSSSDNGPFTNQLTHLSDIDLVSSSMEQLGTVKRDLSPCRLRDLTRRSSSDNDTSDSQTCSKGFLNDDTLEWNIFRGQLHQSNILNWTSNWVESFNNHHESSPEGVLHHQQDTLCALQVLDDAGHLNFNVLDPSSLDEALNHIGVIDQHPPSSMKHRKIKRVSFWLPEDGDKPDQELIIKDILKKALSSLSPMQVLAVDVLNDSELRDWLQDSAMPFDETLEMAFSTMSPIQSLAVAVQAGYVDVNSLSDIFDSSFIRKNTMSYRH